jgi:hypothetical protein
MLLAGGSMLFRMYESYIFLFPFQGHPGNRPFPAAWLLDQVVADGRRGWKNY